MIKSRIAVAGALLAVTGMASAAGFSVTPTIATDYDFRGQSQTNPDQDGIDPAFQLGVNYGLENGVYLGLWGSNVDLGPGDPSIEVDYTAGYAGGDAAESFGYDVGVTYYTYLSDGWRNTAEIYAGLSKGWFSGKLWYSNDYASSDDSGFYLEGNASIPLPVENLSLLAHIGYSDVQNARSLTDYSIGVGYKVGNFATTLKYVDGSDFIRDASSDIDNHVVLAISTTLPWAE